MPRFLTKMLITGLMSAVGSIVCAETVVVASIDSPVRTLTPTQLSDIYLGRLTRLPNGHEVLPIDQDEQTAAHSDFYQYYLERSPAQIRSHWSRLIFTGRGQPPKSVTGDSAMAEVLDRNPNAIGYMDSESLTDDLRVIDIES